VCEEKVPEGFQDRIQNLNLFRLIRPPKNVENRHLLLVSWTDGTAEARRSAWEFTRCYRDLNLYHHSRRSCRRLGVWCSGASMEP